MTSLDKLTHEVNSFFEEHKSPSMQRLADFGSRIITRAAVMEILESSLDNPEILNAMSQASYMVSPNFLKLFIHRDPLTEWGLRVHAFTPGDIPLDEPWHEHRWHLTASILKGAVHSENTFARLTGEVESDPNSMYYYEVPDKRKIGKVAPRFMGRCVLDNLVRASFYSGTTYAHHSDLAHHLTLLPQDGTTITAVITAPPNRTEAAFIEPEPLNFEERPTPAPLGQEATRRAIEQIISELSTQSTREANQPTRKVIPHFLHQTPTSTS